MLKIDIPALQAGKSAVLVTSDGVETWRKINHPHYNDSDYPTVARFVSNQGRIMKNNGEITHGSKTPDGYCVVGVNSRKARVHTIVNLTFNVKPVEDLPGREIYTSDHLNGNRSDNKASNLAWRNQQEQFNNRGVKRHELLEEGEERVLKKPSLNAPISRKKVIYGPRTCEIVYQSYVKSAQGIAELAAQFGIKPSTATTYVTTQYITEDANVLLGKLGLDKATLVTAYEVMRATQIIREEDKSLKAEDFTADIHAALGEACTDRILASGLLGKLYRDLC